MTGLKFDARAGQLVGSRERQNDAALYGDVFALVADGVGSEVGAAAAADLVVQVWAAAGEEDGRQRGIVTALLDAPAQAARMLHDRGLTHGATVAGAFLDDGLLWLTSVGDSRVVVLRRGRVLFASRPHNRAADLLLHDRDATVTPHDHARLTRRVADDATDTPDLSVVAAAADDVVVAMTDGIDALVRLGTVADLTWVHDDPQLLVDALLDQARTSRDADNATCVVARVVEETPPGEETS